MDSKSKVTMSAPAWTQAPVPGAADTSGPRVRIAVLWVVYALSMAAAILLALVEPGVIEDVIAGRVEDMEITELVTLMFAAFILIPLVMAYLALVLPDAANRWVNGIVAGLFSLTSIVDLSGHLTDGTFGGEALMMVATVVAGLLIVWNAWRWRGAYR